MVGFVIKVSILLCCNFLIATAFWPRNRKQITTKKFSLQKHKQALFASPRVIGSSYHNTKAYHRRRRTIVAAIMTPEDGGTVSSGGGATSVVSPPPSSDYKETKQLPNWRVVDVHSSNNNDDSNSSPFCHTIQSKEPSTSTTVAAAQWSPTAYNSAIQFYNQLTSCTDPYISKLITQSIHDIEMSFRLYGQYNIISSYNGGKDAVVIFHLVRAVHAHYCQKQLAEHEAKAKKKGEEEEEYIISRPRVIYFQHNDEFPEVLSLLHDTVLEYDVDMIAFKEGVSFGDGLNYLVERNVNPSGNDILQQSSISTTPFPLAFVLGTRKNDPNAGSQGIYAPSSHYMPPFLRVNPILDWTYGNVWYFLRLFNLPYCCLYDEGYTSLGTVKDTLPCPALKKETNGSSGNEEEYWPAYMLKDWDLERAGRIDKKKEKETIDDKPDQKEASQEGEKNVRISQTSSTVSMPPSEDNEISKLTESISTVFVDDEVVAPDTKTEDDQPSPLSQTRPTVGLIVIGDELLKGLTPDSNINSAAKALRANNITLTRVSIISDDGDEIVDEIQRYRKEVDVIITSGGVGPTHDDITINSVAKALDLKLELNDEMAELLLDKMPSSDTESDYAVEETEQPSGRRLSVAQEKMATLPTTSQLQYLTDDKEEWPVLQCKNIFILPGVPSFFAKKITSLAAYLPTRHIEKVGLNVDDQSDKPVRSDTYRIVLSLPEEAIVSILNLVVAAHPNVSFGSYPIVDQEFKTIITLEGKFFNGGSNKESERLLEKSIPNKNGGDIDAKRIQSMFFSKEDMDRNVELALNDIKSRLPAEGILFIDSIDDLYLESK